MGAGQTACGKMNSTPTTCRSPLRAGGATGVKVSRAVDWRGRFAEGRGGFMHNAIVAGLVLAIIGHPSPIRAARRRCAGRCDESTEELRPGVGDGRPAVSEAGFPGPANADVSAIVDYLQATKGTKLP